MSELIIQSVQLVESDTGEFNEYVFEFSGSGGSVDALFSVAVKTKGNLAQEEKTARGMLRSFIETLTVPEAGE